MPEGCRRIWHDPDYLEWLVELPCQKLDPEASTSPEATSGSSTRNLYGFEKV